MTMPPLIMGFFNRMTRAFPPPGWMDPPPVLPGLVGDVLVLARTDVAVVAVDGLAGYPTALTWLAVIAGLSAKTVDGASAFSYPLIFLPFVSSAFVVTATMPGPVRAFAENQPVTSIVNTIRDFYAQQPVGTDIWIALAWCVGILIVAFGLAMATYHRKIS